MPVPSFRTTSSIAAAIDTQRRTPLALGVGPRLFVDLTERGCGRHALESRRRGRAAKPVVDSTAPRRPSTTAPQCVTQRRVATPAPFWRRTRGVPVELGARGRVLTWIDVFR
jgi:hypothetical protein